MLPRRQSIFHLGEEGGAAAAHHHHRVGVLLGAPPSVITAGGRRARERERLVVGLQILVHHQHHHHHHGHHHGRHGHGYAASVVMKQMVRPRAAAVVVTGAGSRHGGHAFSCSFLKACYLCKRELCPDKDVYMYRGDQGFCSEECRWQQILVDEACEREAAAVVSKERQRRGQARHHSPHRTTPIRGRPPRKTLAAVA
ncbi:hypothetical protein U9M48_038691 [Paspalum notatum var. saurae]|uniref:FLZ-type domain-containing protein n=1 Tax=Paspalum notatum var. saurae TaxID=547442 RepID=A0AAQ3UJ31_PASNO